MKTPASPTMMSPMAMDVDEEVVFAKEESPATSEDVVDDPFERMVSEAMKKSSEPGESLARPWKNNRSSAQCRRESSNRNLS